LAGPLSRITIYESWNDDYLEFKLNLTLSNPIALAIKTLYGFVQEVDKGIDELLEKMKQSENTTVVRTANIIEGAKYGFGLGYGTSVIVIAVGQLILGNPLSAAATVVTAATLTNPIAMTCGAIGAIYYGWNALSDDDKNAIVNRLMEAFEVGAELIKAIVNFVVKTAKELLSAENLAEVRRFITEAASAFGRTLSDVTKAIKDTVVDGFETISTKVMDGASGAQGYISEKFRKSKADPEPKKIGLDK
jgi:hypothetical protein